jgi:hypothetical protein
MTKLSGSFKGKANWLTTIPQSDVSGHEVSIIEIRGKQSSQDAQWNNATVTYWGVGDLIAGNGEQRGCFVNQHADGDTDRGFFEGRVTTTGGKTTLEGTWTITGGTGKFTGATGNGKFRTQVISPTELECSWDGQYQTAELGRGAGR